jgi:hypothetical protein
MASIVGRIYRRQEYQQPWWLVALAIFGSLVGFVYFAVLAIHAGQAVWTGFRAIPIARQQLTGRVAAMAMGLPWLSWSIWRWRERLYLAAPMRDLVTTPASPWQILKIALRMNGAVGQLYGITFVLFLYPWFNTEWLTIATSAKSLNWIADWTKPFALCSAMIAALIIAAMNNAIGIAMNIVLGAAGFGGVAARFRNLERVLSALRRPIFFILLSAFGLMLLVSLVSAFPFPVPTLTSSSLWGLGESMLQQFEQPGTAAHTVMAHFPTVCWFDALTHSMTGEVHVFSHGINCCVATLVLCGLASAVCLSRALSMPVRAGWHGVSDPAPADAQKSQPRRFDPDVVNGPLESWLLARIGRMGRATLRLMAQNFEAGAIDVHLRRSLLVVIPCIALGYAAMYVTPPAIEFLMRVFQSRGLEQGEREGIEQMAAAICVALTAVFRLHLWGTWRAAGAMLSYTPQQTVWQLDAWQMKRAPLVITRGDGRHPAYEVYAVGFKDAVLLPTFYTMAWLFPVLGIAALESLALQLPPRMVGWSFLIALPALAQLFYFGVLISILSYWMHYSRSRLQIFFKSLAWGLGFGTLVAVFFGLVAFLCTSQIEANRPWVAWLGTVNMAVIFNVALYSIFRWMYIQRRFDAERQQPRSLA